MRDTNREYFRAKEKKKKGESFVREEKRERRKERERSKEEK